MVIVCIGRQIRRVTFYGYTYNNSICPVHHCIVLSKVVMKAMLPRIIKYSKLAVSLHFILKTK